MVMGSPECQVNLLTQERMARDYCVKCHLQFYLQSHFCAVEMVMSVELGISVDLGQVHSRDKYFQGLLAKCWILMGFVIFQSANLQSIE